MKQEQLLVRAAFAFVLATLLFVLLAAASADATPIKPSVQQMLKEAERPKPVFIPARVGWSASASAKPAAPAMNVDQVFDQAAEARAARAAVRVAAVPEPGIVAGMFALIFLLRRLRTVRAPVLEPQPA